MSSRRQPSDYHPASPLSPRMDNLAIPSQAPRRRPASHRSHSGAPSSAQLKLPALPRFHPATFASQNSSIAPSPSSGGNSPQPPTSPRSAQRQYSDAQRQLYLYQRELMATANRGVRTAPTHNPSTGAKPASPRLIPMGSPGPVTPLELESEGDYLVAGARAPGLDHASQNELVERLIQEEASRRGEMAPQRTTASTR